jgi:hypothetical protein
VLYEPHDEGVDAHTRTPLQLQQVHIDAKALLLHDSKEALVGRHKEGVLCGFASCGAGNCMHQQAAANTQAIKACGDARVSTLCQSIKAPPPHRGQHTPTHTHTRPHGMWLTWIG